MKNKSAGKHKVIVSYFFMPARANKPSEVILVPNSRSGSVWVPMREEDIELVCFYQRLATITELARFTEASDWLVFSSWEELEDYHANFDIDADALAVLAKYKKSLRFSEEMAAA